MKVCIGTCVDNPFNTIDQLNDIIDDAREISKRTFVKHCFIEPELKKDMAQFPYDYAYYKNKNIYFFTWSAIEHFYQ